MLSCFVSLWMATAVGQAPAEASWLKSVPADVLFALIGADPHTSWLPPQIARTARGFLLSGEELANARDWPLERPPYPLETSMPGVIAAGDVRHSSVKRVASAVGEGSIAIRVAQTLLADDRPGLVQPAAASLALT